MTLKPSQIHAILQDKKEDFMRFDQRSLTLLKQYRSALMTLSQMSSDSLDCFQKRTLNIGDYGATPLEDLNGTNHSVLPFHLNWKSREQSLRWVYQKLTGVTTFAVDGSQIFPGKDLSIPVALVQIGWFENPHSKSGVYEKDLDVDVMTPSDLKARSSGEPVDRRVNFRRLEMEIDRLVKYIKDRAQEVARGKQYLVFFDGSLLATFAKDFETSLRQGYVNCFVKLMRASQRYRVPLVGYVDTSYARDLTVMLQREFELPDVASIHDTQLVNPYMKWGDRTTLMQSQRSGIIADYEEQQNQLMFTYLKATRDAYPARLEMPLWMYEEGIVDQVVDWVRGEVIIGGGYPYGIETADQAAVIRSDDRQLFLRILQDWSDSIDLNLRFSRKMVSKSRRRR